MSPSDSAVLMPESGAAAGAPPDATLLLPAFLKIAGRKVLLVGAGPVATAKFPALVAAGAHVTVISPEVHPDLRIAADLAGATLLQRPFAPSDLEGVWFVVSAAPPEVNRQVLLAAEPRCLFVNAVDDPPSATAYAGAVVRRGPIILAISTAGAAPALAGLVREALCALLPEDIERWTEVAHAARVAWKKERAPMAARRPLLLEALNQLYQSPPPPPVPAADASLAAGSVPPAGSSPAAGSVQR